MADNNNFEQNNQQYYQNNDSVTVTAPIKEEKANVGLAILSFIIPIVGLILFITQKSKKPKTAKASGICALVSIILSIVVSIAITIGGGMMFGSAIDDVLSDEGEVLSGTVIGDYECAVTDYKLCKDWEGKDALLVTYSFTNNSSDSISFDVALDVNAYQEGIGLETAILSDEDTDILDVDIKPGVTKEVKQAYVLRDNTTKVELEIQEFLSFNNDKLVTEIDIAG